MAKSQKSGSLFSQKLDRVAFTSYFLGAVVPLVALAFVVQRYVLPELTDGAATLGLVGLVVSIAVLSLSSFLILRRTTRGALTQMAGHNRRLTTLLDVSESLSTSQHGNEAAATAATHALALCDGRAAFVMLRRDGEDTPVVLESAGQDASKLLQALAAPLGALAVQVMGENRAALCGAGASGAAGAVAKLGPAAVVPLTGDTTALGVLAVIQGKTGRGFEANELDALSTLASLASVALRNAELRDSQRNFFAHVTEMLVSALDSHLGYHAGHGNRVAGYANRIGRELGLDEPSMHRLHFAALLHDIGMLKIDRPLLDNQKACMKHTILGARMLIRINLWRDLAPLVQSHHEWFDGSGYPEGLAGEQIPLLARIIALCEAVDTMTSSTSYKVAVSFEEALTEVESCAGSQFDPQVVQAFRRLVDSGVLPGSIG